MISGGRWAKVVKAHPEAHAVDIVYLDTGAPVPMVPVLTARCSTNTGMIDLPGPTPPASAFSVQSTKDRDVYAAVVPFGGVPVVIGFKVPEIGQMTFAEADLRIDRHGSDFYAITDSKGNWELYHPSGTFFAINDTGAHRDLTGTDVDGLWKIAKNTSSAVHVRLTVKNAGVQKADLHIAPNGDVSLTNVGNLTTNTTGNASVTVGGTTDLASTGKVTVTCPAEVKVDSPKTTFTGEVIVQGKLTYQAGMVGSGGTGSTATITGNIAVTSGDVTADGKSLKTHIHTDPQGGSTGPPS